MSAYATRQDMLDYYGSREPVQTTSGLAAAVSDGALRTVAAGGDATALSAAERAAAEEVVARMDRALADAEAIIETYLVDRYALPLSPVPARLRAVCCDIARYELHPDSVPDAVAARHEEALRWLRDVAGGRARIGVDDANEAPRTADVAIETTERQFGAEALREAGYRL